MTEQCAVHVMVKIRLRTGPDENSTQEVDEDSPGLTVFKNELRALLANVADAAVTEIIQAHSGNPIGFQQVSYGADQTKAKQCHSRADHNSISSSRSLK
ncbi:hypothetical protein WJX77_008833 [Trebouxia sp. C0004]